MEFDRRMTELAAKVMVNEVRRLKPSYRSGQWNKLSDSDVRAIRKAIGSNTEIAAKFHVSSQHIAQIRALRARFRVK